MSIKGIIFDLDGVLVDTVPTHFSAWRRMFQEYGYEFGKREYRRLVDGRPRFEAPAL
jgi:beta-phosphoglucomutase